MNEHSSPRLSRTAVVAACLVLIGLVLAAAAAQRRPGPRLSRRAHLVDLIRAEDARVRELRRELDELKAALNSLEVADAARVRTLAELRKVSSALAPYAGTSPVFGPGVTAVLRDSSLRTSPTGDPSDLVIHEQDLQAVVNGLWGAGAEAIAVNGERITANSAIRCVGNTLLLHGSVYSPPYRIAAIGDPGALVAGMDANPLVARFREAVRRYRLGFEVRTESRLDLPAFGGLAGDRYAVPA